MNEHKLDFAKQIVYCVTGLLALIILTSWAKTAGNNEMNKLKSEVQILTSKVDTLTTEVMMKTTHAKIGEKRHEDIRKELKELRSEVTLLKCYHKF